MNFIEHIIEPTRLLLVWQSNINESRGRLVVGIICREENKILFRYLPDSSDFREALSLNFTNYPAFKRTDKIYDSGVIDAFMRRLPPRSRKDFKNYLENLRIKPEAEISDFALLGYAEAKLPSDGFSIIHPFDEVDSPCELLVEIAGFRYTGIDINEIRLGEKVYFVPEPNNPVDPNAIAINLHDVKIGYINRVQNTAFNYWLTKGKVIEANIERINGQPNRPLIYVFTKIT